MKIPTPCAALILLAGCHAAMAAEATPTMAEQERQSLASYAAAHKACREWTDGCIVCSRRDDDTFACSLPGIACEPTALLCRDARPESAPSPPGQPAK
jgi:hypothetical protein